MLTSFIFARHGEVENQTKTVYGPSTPLSSVGESQMINLGVAFQNQGVHIDVIFSSPLIRAHKSAEKIREGLQNRPDIHDDQRLAAVDTPKWYGRPLKELYDAGERDIWGSEDLTPDETPEEAEARLRQVFDEIRLTNNGKTVLIVGHELELGLLWHRLNNPETLTEITSFDIDKGKALQFDIDEEGKITSTVIIDPEITKKDIERE